MDDEKDHQYKLQTPTLSHALNSDWQFVYEPAEDTFLLLDALEKEMQFIQKQMPIICLEVGSGAGLIITAISKKLGSIMHCLAVDVNEYACKLSQKTAKENNAVVDVIQADLTYCLKRNSINLIIFNPPYVVTPSDELNARDRLTKSWAGGVNGREVIDRFLDTLHEVLDSEGFGYILLLKENRPEDVMNILSKRNYTCSVVIYRKIRGEELYVVKFMKKV